MKVKAAPAKERVQSEPLFSETFKEVLTEQILALEKERTGNEYYLQLRSLCSFPPSGDFLDLTREKLEDYFKAAAEKHAKLSGLHFRLAVFRSTAKAVDSRLHTDYTALVNSVKLNELDMEYREEAFPSLDDIDAVLHHLNQTDNFSLFLAISLALKLSLSLKDICSLKRKQFQFDGGNRSFIRFSNNSFGNMDRLVYVPDELSFMIEKYADNSGRTFDNDSLLFTDAKERPISNRIFQRDLKKACLKAGVNPFTFHQLRNLSIAVELKNGAGIDQIAENAGITTRWFFRYNNVINELDLSPVKLNNIEIRWNDNG